MDSAALLKKVRKIEIKSKGLSNQIFAGEYHSAFKGRGMMFSEVREYTHGDDVRFIDWNVTARYGSPYVKSFEEEREMTVMLLVDVSASNLFGSVDQTKKDLITELTAVLAFSATTNNDKVGVILFSDQVEKFIPPKKGKKHILRIIREILELEPQSKGTNIQVALDHLANTMKKRCTTFLISDFQTERSFEQSIKLAGKRHDLMALQVVDRREQKWVNIGLVPMQNAETGELKWVDTSSKKVRDELEKQTKIKALEYKEVFRKSGVDYTIISTGTKYTRDLIKLFKKRA